MAPPEGVELFVHSPGTDLRTVTVPGDAPASAVAEAAGVPDAEIFTADSDEPVDRRGTVSEQFANGDHVSVTACKKVTVTVRYGGPPYKEREFPPSVTFQAVFSWATGANGYELSQDQKAKHTLALAGSNTTVDKTDHLARHINSEGCELVLDLAPKERFAG